jgi:glycosyltransferase involved in cell wall biosynthesis
MYYDQLLALSELGHEISLWHFASIKGRQSFRNFVEREPGTWAKVKQCSSKVYLSEYRDNESFVDRGLRRVRSLLGPRLPVPRQSLLRELDELIEKVQPEFIWAQHFEPAVLAAQQSHVPVVYVHHDWLYRIKALRNLKNINAEQVAIEHRLVRAVASVVSGSASECEEIKAVGARWVHYIPVSFEPVTVRVEDRAHKEVRLVHLGGMRTTANRAGLAAFFDRVWPQLRNSKLQLEIIGDISTAPTNLQEQLKTAHCTGFVPDLTKVLRPYDIHIIPWEHSTGQRTRLPLAFNHSQVVVATKAAVACYPEARDGENCRLVDRLEDRTQIIQELIGNPGKRVHLGITARATFENCFTRAALLPRFATVISSLN